MALGISCATAMYWGCSSEDEQQQGLGAGTGVGGGFGGFTNVAGAGGGESCAVASDQAVPRPVDIIVGIDTSPSMGEELAGVINNINDNLVTILEAAGLDYHVVFITNNAAMPTGERYFRSDHDIKSSDMLTLFLWTYSGMSRDANSCHSTPKDGIAWNTFLRPQAFKVFIAVTDDDPTTFNCPGATAYCQAQDGWNCTGCANNCASGYCPMWQCATYADAPAEWGGGTFVEELYKLDPPGMFGIPERPRWIFHSIIPVQQQLDAQQPVTGLYQVCNQNGNTGETSGVEYQKLSILTGGIRFPSCDTDYSPVFQTIASTITPMACAFYLEETDLGQPDPNEVNVEIDWGDGSDPELIPQDTSAPCDEGAQGWQWNDEGDAIILCGDVCEQLQSDSDAAVSITVGCATVIR